MKELTCIVCGKVFVERYRGQRYRKNYLCSPECSHINHSERSSITMAKTNRKYASERMKKNNPMKNPETREKVKTALRAIGHKPVIQGGNGRGPTIQQLAVSNALGWDMEVVVKTKMGRYSGFPTCYKIDVGNETLKIGIEVDGASHSAHERKKQDIKKDKFLTSLGWTILRFKNKEIENNFDYCMSKIMETVKNA